MRTISFQRKISKARLVFSVCNDFGEQICGFGRCTCGILLQKLTLKWSTPSLAPEPEILTLRQRSWILKILSVIPIISLFVRVPYYFYRNSNYSGHMKYNCGIRAYILRTGLDEYALRLHKNNICSICKNEIQIAKIQKQSDSWFEKNQYTIFMSEKIEDREIPVILLISMFVDVVFYKNYRHLSVYKKERNIIEASNPVPTPLLGHRCRSSQEITGSPTPFSTSNHYLWICESASFSLSNPNIAA